MDLRKEYFRWKDRNKYTQNEIAEILECSRAAIASFETGRNPLPRGETVLRMLGALYPGWDSGDHRINDHTCVSCNGHVPGPRQHAKYCIECGESFADACYLCGTINPKGAKFCNECGYNMQEAKE